MRYKYWIISAILIVTASSIDCKAQPSVWLEEGRQLLSKRESAPALLLGRKVLKALSPAKDSIVLAQRIEAFDLIGRCFEIDVVFDSAAYYRKKALDFTIELYGRNTKQTAWYLDNFAGFYAGRAQGETSMRMRYQALEILIGLYMKDSLGVRDIYAKVYNNLAALHTGRGETDLARQYLDKGLTLATFEGKESPRCYLLIQSGSLYAKQGNFEAAFSQLSLAGRSLPLESRAQSYFLSAWADYYRYKHFPDSARMYHFKQLEMLEKRPLGPTDVAHCLFSLALDCIELKEYTSAIPFLDSAIAIETRIFGTKFPLNFSALRHKGLCLEQVEDTITAIDCYERALILNGYEGHGVNQLRDAREGFWACASLARLYAAMGRDTQALERCLLADSILFIQLLRMEEPNNKAKLSSEARYFYEISVATAYNLFTRSQNSIFRDHAYYFVERYKCLLARETFLVADLLKLSGLPDSMRLRLDSIKRNKTDLTHIRWALLDRLNEKKMEAPETDPLVQKISGQLSDIAIQEAKMEAYFDTFPKFKQLKQQKMAYTGAQVLELALNPFDRRMAEYWVDEKGIYIFILSRSGIELHFEPIIKDTLQQWVHRFRLGIVGNEDENFPDPGNSYFPFYQDYGYRLYEILLKNYRPLRDIGTWVIVPDDCLWMVPFEALLTSPSPSRKNFKAQPYLSAVANIGYSYSGTALSWLSNRAAQAPGLIDFLGFAPFCEKNEQELKNIFPGNKLGIGWDTLNLSGRPVLAGRIVFPNRSKIFFSSNASKSAFLEAAGHSRIIEIFSHAISDVLDPAKACLIFKSMRNGSIVLDSLFADEVVAGQINAELAIILGCGTGNGQIHQSIGMMSLGQAFVFSGAKSVIGAFWPVYEGPGAEIMTNFFSEIQLGEPCDRALGTAKRKYIESADNSNCLPYYWAGIFLQGATGTVLKQL